MVDKDGPSAVITAYTKTVNDLDKELAKTPSNTTGPFLTALQSLHGGSITPIIGGAFGECSLKLIPFSVIAPYMLLLVMLVSYLLQKLISILCTQHVISFFMTSVWLLVVLF